MRKVVWVGLLLIGAMAFVPAPAVADEHNKVEITGEGFARMEYLDDFDDFNSDTGRSIDFTSYLVRIGFGFAVTDNIDAFAQIQASGLWGDAEFRAAGDPLLGSIGQAPFDNDNLLMYQGYVDFKDLGPVSHLRVGRQEHVLGNELHMGDNDFYNGQFFDGVRATFGFDSWDMDAFWYTIEERDITSEFGFSPGSNDTSLQGVTANFEVAEGQEIEPYILHYRDGEGFGEAMYDLFTYGALYRRPPSDDKALDWSVEAALQSGDVNNFECPGTIPCDLSSSIFEGWVGYSWGDDARHRVHLGGLMLGDGDDPNDVEWFIGIAPDTHRRAGALDLFSENPGFFDSFHNLTTFNVGYAYTGGRHGLSASYHDFKLTEDFGSIEDEIGQEIDLIYSFDFKDKVGFELGAATFMPGDLSSPPNDDNAMRVWAMMKLN